ncbi:DUF6544 family protein [Spirillospora sp. NPDC047279]|uniref:DUF6544 family protein n=1 Tax=Spirillospora sp. NPDC047279 TaxID=3155478 RepID=UPI0033F2BD0F
MRETQMDAQVGERMPPLTDEVGRDWRRLAGPTGPVGLFDPAAAETLPEPARRWVVHAIEPGTPLLTTARLSMRGEIRLGRWLPFEAEQVLRPPCGFVWAATAHLGTLPVTGFDSFVDGSGRTRWRLLDLLPLSSGAGPRTSRGAAGRLAAEFVLSPACAFASWVRWIPVNERRVIAFVTVHGIRHRVSLTVGHDGALSKLTVMRWGAPGGRRRGRQLFYVNVTEEATFDGFTIPSAVEAGWLAGGERPFIRYTIDQASYRWPLRPHR